MEIRTLRSFLTVAREGNVTRAARQLHITQPALSRQLSELERELGCELLVREPRGVTLTEQGMLLRKRANEIVLLADRTEREVRLPTTEVEGDVWVGGGESRVMLLVARLAAEFKTAYPGVRFRIHSGNGVDVLERIDKGLLDFGVVFGEGLDDDRHESLKLPYEDRWGVLMLRDHPLAERESVTLEDLRGERLVVSGEIEGTDGRDSLAQHRVSLQGCDVVATYTLLYNGSLFVEEGLGMALCFGGIVSTGEGTPFSYVPLDGVPPVSSYLIWKRYQSFSRPCDLFLRRMQELSGTQKG